MAGDRNVLGRMSRHAVNRTAKVVDAVESNAVAASRGMKAGGQPWTYGVVRARVTTAIPAGTWTSPSSSGKAQIRHKNASGAWVDSGDPVTVYNDHTFCSGTSSIAVNKVVKLGWIGGDWWLVGADN